MTLLNKLKGNDLRSIGRANKVVEKIGDSQRLFDEIFAGIFDNDSVIRMRASDVAEKVSQKYPHLLKIYKKKILKYLGSFAQQEVRWHIALMLSYMQFTKTEVDKVFAVLSDWAKNDNSKIVRVNSLQALTDIALDHSYLKNKTVALIKNQIKSGSPSIISRGKKLLVILEK